MALLAETRADGPLSSVILASVVVADLTVITVFSIALAVTGAVAARIGGSPPLRPSIRLVVGGALALAATWLIGTLLGTAGVV
jgi:VIT1/CCC1 family predicted Fe2+/Mn2+ transporter